MLKICVIGLGYVGLPICLKISKKYDTVGFDTNNRRISYLKKSIDENKEFKKKDFINKKIFFTNKIYNLKNCNFFIICVPTPIKKSKLPDLNSVKKSFELISSVLKKNDIIVLESTVYPGVTKNFSKKLEIKTNLKNNKDFFVCYSPERINPGDKKNKLTKINKIIGYEGTNSEIKNKLRKIYSNLCKNLIFTNKINEAETAKGIENIQRDLNIAFYNEVLLICNKLNINFNEVIRLAATKWNFIKFSPGLVGGHCLPVDPYYLTYAASKKKYKSKVTLAGRTINNSMKKYVMEIIKKKINKFSQKNKSKIKIIVLGLTYKYGVSDTRNSQKLEIFNYLKKNYKNTIAYDPYLNNIKFKSVNNNLHKNDYFLFLSKGKKFKNLFNKISKNSINKIIDPFFYYIK
tara:strand:+ start:471 stop:1682 length:1212 start_codon:yes stop_codon:yes gene_type:complete